VRLCREERRTLAARLLFSGHSGRAATNPCRPPLTEVRLCETHVGVSAERPQSQGQRSRPHRPSGEFRNCRYYPRPRELHLLERFKALRPGSLKSYRIQRFAVIRIPRRAKSEFGPSTPVKTSVLLVTALSVKITSIAPMNLAGSSWPRNEKSLNSLSSAGVKMTSVRVAQLQL
jgi:hypothetical protein